MNVKLPFYLILIVLLFSACNENDKESTVIINPKNFQHQKFSLSHIADSIKYIPIDNQIQFSAFYDVKMDDKYLYCATPQGILLYNKKGELLRRIGKKGRGPGEYVYGNHIAINEDNQDIIVLDIKRLLIYSVTGKLKRTISLDDLGVRFGDIEYNEGRIYLAKSFVLETEQQWVALDTLGQVLTEKINPLIPFSTNFGFNTRMFKFNNKLHYWNHYNDTIYDIGKEDIKARFLFADGNFRLPKEKIKNITSYFTPMRIMESNHYLIIDYVMLKILYLTIYDKSKKKFLIVSSTKICEKKLFPLGFQNDFDAGVPFRPMEYFLIEKEEYLMCWINSFDIKTKVDSKAFKNSVPKFPGKKKELEKLANDLSESDNPVLMLIKLKE